MFHERKQRWRGRKQLHLHHFTRFIVQKVDCLILLTTWEVPSSSNIILLSYDFLLSLLSLIYTSTFPAQLKVSFSQPLLFISFLFFSFLSTSSQFFHPSSATALCTSISIIGNLLVHTLCILLTFCSHRVTLLLISVTIQTLSVRSLQLLLQL